MLEPSLGSWERKRNASASSFGVQVIDRVEMVEGLGEEEEEVEEEEEEEEEAVSNAGWET